MKQHDYQYILDRPVSADVDDNCKTLVSQFRDLLSCRRDVYENMTLRSPGAMDACRCYPPCSDVTYDSSYSLSTLPPATLEHTTFYTHLDRFLESTLSPEKRRLLGVGKNDITTVPLFIQSISQFYFRQALFTKYGRYVYNKKTVLSQR